MPPTPAPGSSGWASNRPRSRRSACKSASIQGPRCDISPAAPHRLRSVKVARLVAFWPLCWHAGCCEGDLLRWDLDGLASVIRAAPDARVVCAARAIPQSKSSSFVQILQSMLAWQGYAPSQGAHAQQGGRYERKGEGERVGDDDDDRAYGAAPFGAGVAIGAAAFRSITS